MKRRIVRFEVLGRSGDRQRMRSLAERLAIRPAVSGEPPEPGGILNALRRSPLVGAGLDLKRPPILGRKVER